MARPREFDPEEALAKAMHVFWQHGYEGASLPDLLHGMGLTRGSLYKAFQDKKNLFLLVLERYEISAVETAVILLNNPDISDGADRILFVFKSVAAAVEKGDRRGCMLCTAASGSAANDPDIAAALQHGLNKIRMSFIQALKDAPALSEISTARRLRLGNTLLTQYVGLRVLARSQLDLGVMENAVQAVEEILVSAGK